MFIESSYPIFSFLLILRSKPELNIFVPIESDHEMVQFSLVLMLNDPAFVQIEVEDSSARLLPLNLLIKP